MAERSGTLFVSAARTLAQQSADVRNRRGARGVAIFINLSARPAAGSITVTIQEKNPLTGAYSTLLASAAIAAISQVVLKVYPGMPAVTNISLGSPLPETWRVDVAVGNSDSLTYSISYTFLD